MNNDETLSIWTIYKHPSDYPKHYVARRWLLDKPTKDILLADNLDVLRSLLPNGLYKFNRQVNDDPCIVEVWI